MITDARSEEFTSVREAVRSWASRDDEIVAVVLVGSWARGEPQMDSDADVIVFTDSSRFVEQGAWATELFGDGADVVRTTDWGALTERRVRLPSGFEIEFGFAMRSWADVAPVDSGTREVISNGCEPWYDPQGLLFTLINTVTR